MSNINTDIYNIAEITEKVKSNFIDESDETLAASTLGFISSIAADSMREAIRVTAKMANEAIYSKATLQSSIITHAMVLGVEGIFATPAVMKAKLVFYESDLLKLMGNDNKLVIDHLWKIMIDDYEFHLDYDIILTKTTITGNKNVYSARYDTSINNKLSNIVNPYIDPPNTIIMDNGATAITFNVILRQVFYNTFYKKFITNNIIDNKTFMFDFENQLCDFKIKVNYNGTTTYVEPVYEGTNPTSTIYCNYSFVTSNKIRIKFDKDVFIPELNSEISVEIFTSLGSKGNFSYNTNFISVMSSDNYDYRSTNTLFIPVTDSKDGADQKSSSQLQALLPIEATSRGSISNADDLTAHFNLENTDSSRIIFKDRAINQFENSYYTYLALKDGKNNMIPTNTINVLAALDEFDTVNESVGYNRYTLKQGCYILSDGINAYAKLNPTYKELKEAKFIYTIPFTCAITDSQLQTSYYMSMSDDKYELIYKYINPDSNLQFITTNINWRRRYLENSDIYSLSFQLTQNITSDMGMIIVDEDKKIIDNKLKVITILYKEGVAYRYKVADLVNYDLDNFTFEYNIDFESSDLINEENHIRINNVNIIGQDETVFDYGYFEANTDIGIYVLYRGDVELGRGDIDDYVPGLFGYTLSNMYSIDGGVYFFKNYSSIISSVVDSTKITRKIDKDMDWDIHYCKDLNMYISDGVLCIPYKLDKSTDITMTVKDENDKVLFKEYCNVNPGDYPYALSEQDGISILTWTMRDFSSLKNTSYSELHYDEDGNYIYYKGDEELDPIKNINSNYTKIINENTLISINVSSNTNFFTIEHIVSKDDINAIMNNYTMESDYNIIDFTEPDYDEVLVNGYKISSVPVIRKSYLNTEEKVQYIVDMLNNKKDFIENSNSIIESPFSIDLKFVNTYGPSKLYTTKSGDALDRVNLSLKFDIKLKNNADKNVVVYIRDDIKKYIESINKELDDIHMRVIEDTLQNTYSNAVVYVECMQINNYDQTINHLYLDPNSVTNNYDIPEFICINSIGEDDTEPDIAITLV